MVCADADRAAVGHGLDGIEDDIADDLINLTRIDQGRPRFF